MKFLCVCQQGMVRSAAMKIALAEAGQDALPVGWASSGSDTLSQLCGGWAEAIVVMQPEYIHRLEERVVPGALDRRMLIIVDVGPDTYHTPVHPWLLNYLRGIVAQWKNADFHLLSALGARLPFTKA